MPSPSPTVEAFFNRLHSTNTIAFLALWILTTTFFCVMDFQELKIYYFEALVSVSSLTYLICRMIVACSKTPRPDSMVYRLTTSHRRSRRSGLAMLVVTCVWAYQLFYKIITMVVVNMTAAAMLFAHFYPGALEKVNAATQKQALQHDSIHGTDLAENWDLAATLEELKVEMDFDAVRLFGWIPVPILLFCDALLWLALSSLALYVWHLLWSSIKLAFGPSRSSSSHTPASSKTHVV